MAYPFSVREETTPGKKLAQIEKLNVLPRVSVCGGGWSDIYKTRDCGSLQAHNLQNIYKYCISLMKFGFLFVCIGKAGYSYGFTMLSN